MDFSLGRLRLSIRVTVLTFFLLATGLTAAVAIGLQYYFSRELAHSATTTLFKTAADGMVEDLRQVEAGNRRLLQLLADTPLLNDATSRDRQMQLFARVLEADPLLYSVYLGSSDGDLFQLASLASDDIRQRQRARAEERWLLVTVSGTQEGRRRVLAFLDRDLQVMRTET